MFSPLNSIKWLIFVRIWNVFSAMYKQTLYMLFKKKNFMLKGVLVLYNEMMLMTTTFLHYVNEISASLPCLFSSKHCRELPL
jgi:hypothetical protein